ncbi:MAG: hypothetical protein AB8H80_04640 [Planctomycetota bacterium]
MRSTPTLVLLGSAIAAAAATFSFESPPLESPPLRSTHTSPAATDDSQPLALAHDAVRFVPNQGQWQPSVRYAVLGPTVGWLHDDGFSVRYERWSQDEGDAGTSRAARRRCSGAVVRTRILDAAATGFDAGTQHAARHNFLVGDAAHHASNVPSFADVTMRSALPGIDVHFRPLPDAATSGGLFEYDLLLDPAADLGAFVAEVEGAERLSIDSDGQLVAHVETPDGPCQLVQRAPIAWQHADAQKPVAVSFRLLGTTRYGFVAEGLDPTLATTVDPGVVWGTHLGGGSTDRIYDLKSVAGTGVWLGGWSGSTDFPTTVGGFQTVGVADGFVAQLADDGNSLQFATYLGGSRSEEIRGIALAAGDIPVVVGFTNSSDFPVTAGVAQPGYAGGSFFLDIGDAFVTRLTANGSALVSSTFLGGLFDDIAEDVLVDGNDRSVVVGWSTSGDFPVPPGGFQPAFGGLPIAQSDGFVVGVEPNGQTIPFGTFLGGGFAEQLLAIDREPMSGDLVVSGWSGGSGYPTTPAVSGAQSAGAIDAVVTRLSADLSTAVFSTYLGGNDEDAAQTVKFAADASVWVGGFTSSSNFPALLNAPQQTLAGSVDGFVTRISALGQALVASTFLGGPGQDRVRDLDVSVDGLMVVGEAGDQFPLTPDALQTQWQQGQSDAFVTWMNLSGDQLLWSTYFGGTGQDSLLAVEFEDGGLATAAGFTYSPNFPIAPAGLQPQLLGVEDGVVLRFDLLADLGAGMQVVPAPVLDFKVLDPEVAPGTQQLELLDFELVNLTDRLLVVDSVRVLVTGQGVEPGGVRNLCVLRYEDPQGVGATVGEVASAIAAGETTVVLNGAILRPRATTRFTVEMEADQDSTRSREVGAAIVGADSWRIRAPGAGTGPSIGVNGAGRATGRVYVLGQLAGDLDESEELSVVDIRRMINRLGQPAPLADVDGDGVFDLDDLDATRDAVLGLGTVFQVPATIARGSWIRLPGLFPTEDVQAFLGGRSLQIGRVLPRELSLFVEADQPVGMQDLVVRVEGQAISSVLVEVF